MYKVVVSFTDTIDNDYVYWIGQSYPRQGYDPPRKRIDYLLGNKNNFKIPVIELIPQEDASDDSQWCGSEL